MKTSIKLFSAICAMLALALSSCAKEEESNFDVILLEGLWEVADGEAYGLIQFKGSNLYYYDIDDARTPYDYTFKVNGDYIYVEPQMPNYSHMSSFSYDPFDPYSPYRPYKMEVISLDSSSLTLKFVSTKMVSDGDIYLQDGVVLTEGPIQIERKKIVVKYVRSDRETHPIIF